MNEHKRLKSSFLKGIEEQNIEPWKEESCRLPSSILNSCNNSCSQTKRNSIIQSSIKKKQNLKSMAVLNRADVIPSHKKSYQKFLCDDYRTKTIRCLVFQSFLGKYKSVKSRKFLMDKKREEQKSKSKKQQSVSLPKIKSASFEKRLNLERKIFLIKDKYRFQNYS